MAKVERSYVTKFYGPKTQVGQTVPSIAQDAKNFIRCGLQLAFPTDHTASEVAKLAKAKDFKALEEMGTMVELRLQRYFIGKEPNENDKDGLAPSLSVKHAYQSHLIALAPHQLLDLLAMLQEAANDPLFQALAEYSAGQSAKKVESLCPACKAKVKGSQNFCAECGTKLEVKVTEEPQETKPASKKGKKASPIALDDMEEEEAEQLAQLLALFRSQKKGKK